MNIFPQNTTSNFTTLLQTPLQLDGSWQVALTSFSYRLNISMYIGCAKIYKLDNTLCRPNCFKYLDKIEFTAYEGEKYSDLFERMSRFFKAFEDTSVNPPKSDVIKLKVVDKNLILESSESNYLVIFDGRVVDILNLEDTSLAAKFYVLPLLSKYEYLVNSRISQNYVANAIVHHNEFFFFYSDIIADQYVGDVKAKLLETLAIEGVREKSVYVSISNPTYVDVALTEIPTINITIKDSLGENIRFDHFSRVIVKLHFRPKRYE